MSEPVVFPPFTQLSRTSVERTVKMAPCPLCGSSVEATEYAVLFNPDYYPFENRLHKYYGQMRFRVNCRCHLQIDVACACYADSIEEVQEYFGDYFQKLEDHWNRVKPLVIEEPGPGGGQE